MRVGDLATEGETEADTAFFVKNGPNTSAPRRHAKALVGTTQASIDARLVRELATGRFISQAENVLIFGPPGVGKTHLAIGFGRTVVEAGHSVLFTSAIED